MQHRVLKIEAVYERDNDCAVLVFTRTNKFTRRRYPMTWRSFRRVTNVIISHGWKVYPMYKGWQAVPA